MPTKRLGPHVTLGPEIELLLPSRRIVEAAGPLAGAVEIRSTGRIIVATPAPGRTWLKLSSPPGCSA